MSTSRTKKTRVRTPFIIEIILTVSLFLSACTTDAVPSEQEDVAPDSPSEAPGADLHLTADWQELTEGLEIRTMEISTGTDRTGRRLNFTALKIDTGKIKLEVAQDAANPRTVAAWRKQLDTVAVINGGYFTEENLTAGFLIADGIRYGTANKNGYAGTFFIRESGEASVRSTELEPVTEGEDLSGAIQSYPLLLLDSQAQVREDSGKMARRTVVAIDQMGYLILMVERDLSTLYEVSRALALNGDFVAALNLDGGSSSGLSVQIDGSSYTVPSAKVPNVIAVYLSE